MRASTGSLSTLKDKEAPIPNKNVDINKPNNQLAIGPIPDGVVMPYHSPLFFMKRVSWCIKNYNPEIVSLLMVTYLSINL